VRPAERFSKCGVAAVALLTRGTQIQGLVRRRTGAGSLVAKVAHAQGHSVALLSPAYRRRRELHTSRPGHLSAAQVRASDGFFRVEPELSLPGADGLMGRGRGSSGSVRRHFALVEFDRLHVEQAGPLRLVPDRVLERSSRVLLTQEQIDRLVVSDLKERVDTHAPKRGAVGTRRLPVRIGRYGSCA
jgi:hypothetical protein